MEGNIQDNNITLELLKCILEVSKINTRKLKMFMC